MSDHGAELFIWYEVRGKNAQFIIYGGLLEVIYLLLKNLLLILLS